MQFAVIALIGLLFRALMPESPATDLGLSPILDSLINVAFNALNAIAAGVAYHDLRSFREGLAEDELAAVFD